MPDSGAHDLRNLRSDGPTLSATALRSTKAGLVALCIVSFALATFGPWFNLLLAYGLMVASMAVAVAGIWWADRAAHETHRDRTLTNGIYARSGAALSVATLLLSMYYTGLLVLFLVFWPVLFVVLLIVWTLHRSLVDAGTASGVRA